MGSIGGLMGFAGGPTGGGVGGSPVGAPIQTPVSGAQANAANQQMTDLISALQGQNGIGNQTQVYNQLQDVAAGKGPNPAQTMLNQATGQNIASQAALMAGQRGAGANAGLLARQAAQQGAATQQQAAGQAATMQAQQWLNAIGAAGNLATTQAGQQIGTTQANQQALLNAIAGQNNAQVGMQSNINQANAALLNTQMQGQQALLGGVMQGLGSAAGMMGGASAARGGSVEKGTVMAADGADLDDSPPASMSDPDTVSQRDPDPVAQKPSPGPMSIFGKFLQGATQPAPQTNNDINVNPSDPGAAILRKGAASFISGGNSDKSGGGGGGMGGMMGLLAAMAKGGNVKAMVSPGEIYLDPKAVEKVRAGADPMKVGEKIPGKPKVGGAKNSYANDTVKKNLKEGGIVVPRSETKSKTPSRNSKQFVDAVVAKRKSRAA